MADSQVPASPLPDGVLLQGAKGSGLSTQVTETKADWPERLAHSPHNPWGVHPFDWGEGKLTASNAALSFELVVRAAPKLASSRTAMEYAKRHTMGWSDFWDVSLGDVRLHLATMQLEGII